MTRGAARAHCALQLIPAASTGAAFPPKTGAVFLLGTNVCHFPPGTSKWNKIEHRLFSFITQNWRGRPLLSRETIVNLIASTTTRTGLVVKSALDTNEYPTKVKVSDEELGRLRLRRHGFHGEWNYTLSPRK